MLIGQVPFPLIAIAEQSAVYDILGVLQHVYHEQEEAFEHYWNTASNR